MTLSLTLSSPIELVADGTTSIDAATLSSLPTHEQELEIVCASGDRYTDTWRGVSVLDLLELASVPLETTHLLVESTDGYRVCVAIEPTLEGLLAFERNGKPLAAVADYETRFVSTGVDGPKTVKDVDRIETKALAPGEDPESYEELWPDE